MTADDDLYPHWLRVREALQLAMPEWLRRLVPLTDKTTGETATLVVEALRAELTNDTVELTKRLHVGAAEAGWNTTLLAFVRMALDHGYFVGLRALVHTQSRDGWALTHALLIELPGAPEGGSMQVSYRLTDDQTEEIRRSLGVEPGPHYFDGHSRREKYTRLERFANRPRRKK